MELKVNGEPQTVPDQLTVLQLLERLQVTPEQVVVEVNLTVLKRAQHATTMLRPGDAVEIVRFVGGGV